MMVDDRRKQDFGCGRCWPPTADAAGEARERLAQVAGLIDESHFHVMIFACPVCTQRFVSVFTESIDWQDGDDPQYWTLLPITEAEADDLIRQQDSLTETRLNALGADRRSLQRDHPKATEACNYWGTGIFVGPHD
ncbi:MAG TPA: hypothetical protein VJ440_01955 [Candidatus Brocadiaceae bacterium]|nr:hypothetical protein [Candidatus Brocadiaceae bacterium]